MAMHGYELRCAVCGPRPQNWDGSGGNGAAMRHYEATGSRYPLVVKLGTITPHGADVYSYASDENDMVLDPHLVRSGRLIPSKNMMKSLQWACIRLCSKLLPW